jgi:tetratricopeptide (TPR) repeat protein
MDFTEANSRADLALSWLANGGASDAFAALDAIVAAYPDVDRFVFRRGAAAESLGHWEIALEDYRRAIVIHPQFGIFHHAYIRLLITQQGCKAALETYQELRSQNSAVGHDIYAYLAQEVLVAGCDPELLLQFLESPFGRHCTSVTVGDSHELPEGTLRITYHAQGYTLRVCSSALQRRILVTRLFAMVPYFDRLATQYPGEDAVLIALDDLPPAGDDPVLCFSGEKDNHFLIPDALFLESNGYRQLREAIDAHWVPWDQRAKQAYWRGALTGIAWDEQHVFELPRVQLAKLAQSSPNLDARITDLKQFAMIWPELPGKLENQGLLGPREPEIANIQNQILIDVDGNSNAWSGFFLKLLCGSPTIKLMSNYRQWYYRHLTKGVHFIPISDLETSLPKSIDWLLAHPAQAEAMGKAARKLALSMTPESEFSAFQEAFEHAQEMAVHRKLHEQSGSSAGVSAANAIGTKDLGDAVADILKAAVSSIRPVSDLKRYTRETVLDADIANQLAHDLGQGHLVWIRDVWGSKWPVASAGIFSLCIHHNPIEAAILCSLGSDLILCKPTDHGKLSEIGCKTIQDAGFLVSHIALFGWNTLRVSAAGAGFAA